MADRLTITAPQLLRPLTVPDPWTGRALVGRACRDLRPRACLRMLLGYYREPVAWFGALVTLSVLAFAGGAVMFVLHAEILGEQGPAISPVEHWALDSTLGFVGLAPLVAGVKPLAAWLVTPGPASTVSPLPYAVVGGTLFGLAAGPAPIAHDMLVGRGTWLADRVTAVLAPNATHFAHAHGDTVSQALSIGLQIAVGVPTYGLLLWAALGVARAATRRRWALAPST